MPLARRALQISKALVSVYNALDNCISSYCFQKKKKTIQHHYDTPPKKATIDHSTLHHNGMQHGANTSMSMEGHNHYAMMIADFKKRFYVVLILTIPIMLLSAMIQQFLEVNWQFQGSSYIFFALSSVFF